MKEKELQCLKKQVQCLRDELQTLQQVRAAGVGGGSATCAQAPVHLLCATPPPSLSSALPCGCQPHSQIRRQAKTLMDSVYFMYLLSTS